MEMGKIVREQAEQTGGPVAEAVREADEWVRSGDGSDGAFIILRI